MGNCRQIGTRAWGLRSVNAPIGRSSTPAGEAGCWRVDWTSATTRDTEAQPAGERLRRRLERHPTSGAGWVGRFVFHAIAVSFDKQCLPVMHQPVDQGRGQGVVHVEQGAPFPEGSIRGQHDRSGFITGSNYLVMWRTT